MSKFDLWYEDMGEGRAALHCLVHRWVPSARRELDLAAEALVREMLSKGFHTAYAVGAQHPEFCEYMGGEYLYTYKHTDGIDYEVYEWELQRRL